MRIAILEDDRHQLAQLVRSLEHDLALPNDHLSCICFDQSEVLRRKLRHETFDLLILDWGASDDDAIDLLRWLRQYRQDTIPVLMLSSRTAPRDVANALDAGADDYVFKPFHSLELCARVRRLGLRHDAFTAGSRARSDGADRREYFGGWTLDRSTLSIRFVETGDSVVLTDREFLIALTLFRHGGKPVSRAYLLETCAIQGDAESSRALDNHIYRLRSKLSGLGADGVRLQTVYGRGYRLELAEASAKAPASVAAELL